MKKFLQVAALSIFTGFASAAQCDDMVLGGQFPKTVEKVTIICKKRFVIGYSTQRKAPLWVAEVLFDDNVKNANTTRSNSFRPDPSIPLQFQSSLSEFAGSGYDRGHMVPFEDLADDPIAANESFVLTNMIAQAQTHNRGIWRSVETRTRKIALEKKKIYVVTGTVFAPKSLMLAKGTNIPSHVWKIVISPSTNEVFSVMIPNVDGLDTRRMREFSAIPAVISKKAGITILGLSSAFVSKPIN